MELKQHPLSAAFPAMSAEDFQALKDDIENHGQREPVWIFEGMVLDGWHRYRACVELGMKFDRFEFKGNDPVEFVLSHNLHRRHLTASQRAAAVVACSTWAPAHRPKASEKRTPGVHLSTNQDLARAAQVHPTTIKDAKAAHKAGLTDAVKAGALTAKEAAAVARGKAAPAPAPTASDLASVVTQAVPPAPPPVEEHFGPTPEELAAQAREEEEERAALQRLLDSDDKLATLAAENKKLRAMNRVLQERVDGLMAEKAEAIASAKRWQRKAEAAERKLKEAA